MDKNNKENRGLSQKEIDEIIDKVIEQEPVKEIKEHLIKYEREYRRKRDQGQLENDQLKEESITYDKTINHPHDKAVRLMLANSQEAANLINLALKKEDLIKSSQIKQYKSSFVTKDYKNRESDIVYKDNINKGIYYLIEHQSKQDKMMPMRIAEYSIEIMRDALDLTKKEKKCEIPRVIAIVLYTGESKWQVAQTLEAIQVKLPEIESQSVGSYNIVDINTYSEEELLKAKGALPKMLLMEKSSETLKSKVKRIEDCNFTEEERERISIYITNIIREIDTNLAERLLEKINKDEEEDSMRFGQALVDYWYEGVAKGAKENGRKEGKKIRKNRRSKRNKNRSN